jgi:O-succinylbenzoate synthase
VWAELRTGDPTDGLANAALAQATADLEAKRAARPLWQHLGGLQDVWASAAIGVADDGSPDRSRLAAVADAGYRHAKLKITAATDPDELAELLDSHPNLTLGLDANGSLGTAPTEQLKAIDVLGFAYIEQPGPTTDLDGHRILRGELLTPIVLDESADSVSAVERILSKRAADVVNLKAGRFGTVETLRLAKTIVAAGISVRLGGLVESGIGRAHSIALATRREFSVVGDIAGSDLYFDNDLVIPSWRQSEGRLKPPGRPGIGVEVDVTEIERIALDTFSMG